MGVYIKDIEMPKSCADCPCGSIFAGYKCMACGKQFDKYPLENRMDWCPLISVPSHGRLIDEREVQQLLAEMIPVASEIINSKAIIEWVAEYIPQCSTIIPAEPPKEEA